MVHDPEILNLLLVARERAQQEGFDATAESFREMIVELTQYEDVSNYCDQSDTVEAQRIVVQEVSLRSIN